MTPALPPFAVGEGTFTDEGVFDIFPSILYSARRSLLFVPLPSSLERTELAAPTPDLSTLCPQAALQVGGHGERLTQCREVLLTTAKAIPVQVDGEPCKLAASRIRIALRNQATMVQKAKRRSTAPLHSE